MAVVKNRHGHLVHELLKSSEWVYELNSFFFFWCDAIIFGQTNIILYILDFKSESSATVLVRHLAVAGRDLWNMFWPSFLPDIWLGVLWSWIFRFLWIFAWCHKPLWSCAWQPDFFEKLFLPQKLGRWAKNRPKTGIFEFKEKFGHQFLLNLFYNESFY